ncbi:MAG: hypothetical protein JNG88_07415 [Phycisphaerales bacterium]|nr:hypothetical protein [Phycisphaerales bacterium]
MSDLVADKIAIRCASCNAGFRVSAASAGKKGKCPKCGEAFLVPSATESGESARDGTLPTEPAAEVTADGRIKFHCAGCGGALKVASDAVGRRVKCPKCGSPATVPDPAADGGSAGDDLLSGLAGGVALDVPRAAPAGLGRVIAPPPPLDGGADTKPAKTSRGGFASGIGGMLAGGNSLMLGCIFSAVGAGIGGLVWFLIAYNAHYEVGYIAWALGGLAGLGMYLGCRDANQVGGAIAAFMAILGIVIAKFMVFSVILEPVFAEVQKNIQGGDREGLVEAMAIAEVERSGKAESMSETEYEKAFSAAEEKAKTKVAAMTDEQVKAKQAELSDDIVSTARSEMKNAFFSVMFSPMDILFFVLAIATAYKVGSTGTTKAT